MEINLQKGQRIDLTKSSGAKLTSFCVGVNWGAIETYITKTVESGGFLGFGKKVEQIQTKVLLNVDLDLSCIMFDSHGNIVDHIYSPLYKVDILQKFGLPAGKLKSNDGALLHSGDDLEGDKEGDDDIDNEIITVNLLSLSDNVSQIYFFLNNVGKEDFSEIPYAKIRMYEGSANYVKDVFASYNVSSESQYRNCRALILGKLYKKDAIWRFNAIGVPTEDVFLGQTIARIASDYI